MKKIYIIKTIFICSLAIVLFCSSSGGYDDNLSGSPNSSGTCNNCHSGGSNNGGVLSLTGLPSSVVNGQSYSLTLSFSIPNTVSAVRAGFQIEAVDAVTGDPYGTIVAGTDSRDAQGTTGVITHDGAKLFTISGTNKIVSWTFDWIAPPSGNTNDVQFYYVLNATNGNNNTSGDNVYSSDMTVSIGGGATATRKMSAKAFLVNVNSTTSLMSDDIRTDPDFPLTDPYDAPPLNNSFVHVNSGATATITPSVLNISTNDAIIDWVFLELWDDNNGQNPPTVVQTKAALIQKDGDIVDTDGFSPVSFIGASGDFYIRIRHRNHLGCRTLNKVTLTSSPTILDFTNNSLLLNGPDAVTQIGNIYALNGGDANADGSIDSVDSAIWEVQNGLFSNPYLLSADYNLDLSVDSVDSAIWEINNGKFEF